MRNVYLSFLGLGTYSREKEKHEYQPAVYDLNGKKSSPTEFVQAAEIELLGAGTFDKLFIAATQASFDTHFGNLSAQMKKMGGIAEFIPITEEMEAEDQWAWFEKILACIEPEDELTVDITHGFRAIPIVFSAAINFLQKAKRISLKAVYYGAFEKNRKLGYAPIVDMKDFYLINEWADAVSRLVEDADVRKMGQVAENASSYQLGELNDPKVIQAFDDLTDAIRNVDVNNVARKANAALELIETKKGAASTTGDILLGLVIDKFVALTTQQPVSGRYDLDYFKVQIEIIKMLLQHKLFMQAYTVMREFIASLAMIPVERKGAMKAGKRRKRRSRYGEVFFQMFQYDETTWDFREKEDARLSLMPFYESLKRIGAEAVLRAFAHELAKYRNGFDHAWVARSSAMEDIDEKGDCFFRSLKTALGIMEKEGIFKQ